MPNLNDKFEQWWESQGYGDETFIDKTASRENWNAAIESTNPKVHDVEEYYKDESPVEE